MIDWVSGFVPLRHKSFLRGDKVLIIDQQGEIIREADKLMPVEGSYSSAIHLRSEGPISDGYFNRVYISGNLTKFLQGHNIFGTDDLCALVTAGMAQICEILGIDLAEDDYDAWLAGHFEITRADCTYNVELPSREDVRSTIYSLSLHSDASHRKKQYESGTLYYGKKSRRSAMKVYCKGDELNDHPLPSDLPLRSELQQHADKLLRTEAVYRGPEIKRLGYRNGSSWLIDTPHQLHRRWLEKIKVAGLLMLNDSVLMGLSRTLRRTYEAWREGRDLRPILSKSTFYAHRAHFRELGIDITSPRPAEQAQSLPLKDILFGLPAAVPAWAHGTSVYFERGLDR